MVKSIITFFILLLLVFPGIAQEITFSSEEKKVIRKCNTARFSLQHGARIKEFIRLMNLARKDGKLLQKYIRLNYSDEYADRPIFHKGANEKSNAWFETRPLLRPSLGLHSAAWLHAVFSGLFGSSGHQFMDIRSFITLNLLSFVPGNARGENCEYGNNEAIAIFTSLMESPGHRANILNPHYHRVGVSKKLHIIYQRNTVTMFSGKKVRDLVFPFLYRE